MNKKLAIKLNTMAVRDQKMRRKAIRTGVWNHDIDKQNTAALKKIIQQYGWPTISMCGKKASFRAWLLAQHADHDLLFQKKVLKLLRQIYKQSKDKDIDPANIAFLTDRILVAEGKKQIFGTQFYLNKKGVFIPRPIKDVKNIEERRREYGLHPFREDMEASKNFKKLRRRRG